MSQGNHAYIDHVRGLEQRLGSGDEAVRLAVGGEFEAVGKLEYYLLRSLGLTTGHLVVDAGCGSGRLAQQLAPDKGIRHIGTDPFSAKLSLPESRPCAMIGNSLSHSSPF